MEARLIFQTDNRLVVDKELVLIERTVKGLSIVMVLLVDLLGIVDDINVVLLGIIPGLFRLSGTRA